MRRPRAARARGYTLMELIIAAMLSLLVIAGLYMVYATHARVFRGQEMVSQAQIGARYAIQTVTADLRRVGYMTTVDTDDPQVRQKLCELPTNRIIGVQLEQEYTDEADIWNAHAPVQRPDAVTLVGNFTNEETYWVERIVDKTVTLQNNHAIDNTDPFPDGDQAAFEQIFVPEQTLVRIRHSDKVFYSRVTDRNFAAASLTLADSPSCLESLWDGAELNVVNKIRYEVAPADLSESEQAVAASAAGAGLSNRFDLVRRFLSWDDDSVVTTQVVAENVVDFQVWFIFDALGDPDEGPAVDYSDTHTIANTITDEVQSATGNEPCGNGDIEEDDVCSPMRIRGAIVRISTRTPSEDPTFIVPEDALSDHPLSYYDVDPDSVGSCRVRTLTSYVDMPNVRYGQ
jgi:hypothetical protein